MGSTARNADADKPYDGEIKFATTEPLGMGEGLTVAVGFSKGAVIPPTAAELRAQAIRDNAAAITALAGISILLIYFFVAWWTHGRDPKRGRDHRAVRAAEGFFARRGPLRPPHGL